MYKDRWYKIWYNVVLYDGKEYNVFVYAFGKEQVERLVKKFNATKVTEWTI